jgi:hypothetical protein
MKGIEVMYVICDVFERYTAFIKATFLENVECIFLQPKETTKTVTVVIILSTPISNIFTTAIKKNSNSSMVQSLTHCSLAQHTNT